MHTEAIQDLVGILILAISGEKKMMICCCLTDNLRIHKVKSAGTISYSPVVGQTERSFSQLEKNVSTQKSQGFMNLL